MRLDMKAVDVIAWTTRGWREERRARETARTFDERNERRRVADRELDLQLAEGQDQTATSTSGGWRVSMSGRPFSHRSIASGCAFEDAAVQREKMAQAGRVGLERGQVAAAHHRGHESGDAQPLQDQVGEGPGLVGDHHEPRAVPAESLQGRGHAGVERGLVQQVGPVVALVDGQGPLKFIGKLGDGPGQQVAHPFAHVAHPLRVGDGGQAQLPPGEVHRQGQIGPGVDEGAVQVEDDSVAHGLMVARPTRLPGKRKKEPGQ